MVARWQEKGNPAMAPEVQLSPENEYQVSSTVDYELKKAGRQFLRTFTFDELQSATNYFSPDMLLVKYQSSRVWKGVLSNGQTVAVKACAFQHFEVELEILSCAQHRNIVGLVGSCIGEHGFLVYDFVSNGSVAWHLSHKNRDTLGWDIRVKIAQRVAKALCYLHEDCSDNGPIVHRDIRSTEILLTHDFEPKIAGFKHASWQGSTAQSDGPIAGTIGYLAPEYVETGELTEKIDVYAFGVVLLELITGLKCIDRSRPYDQQCLAEWARPLLEEKSVSDLVDQRLGITGRNNWRMHHMIDAASRCVHKDPNMRPAMSKVLRILDKTSPPKNKTLSQFLASPMSETDTRLPKDSEPTFDTLGVAEPIMSELTVHPLPEPAPTANFPHLQNPPRLKTNPFSTGLRVPPGLPRGLGTLYRMPRTLHRPTTSVLLTRRTFEEGIDLARNYAPLSYENMLDDSSEDSNECVGYSRAMYFRSQGNFVLSLSDRMPPLDE